MAKANKKLAKKASKTKAPKAERAPKGEHRNLPKVTQVRQQRVARKIGRD